MLFGYRNLSLAIFSDCPLSMKYRLPFINLCVLLSIVLLLPACKQYHDLTSRFNAYFLAKEKTIEVEETLFGDPRNDYNDILQVLVKIDTNQTKSQAAGFEYIIEKASKPIQWHENSKWVDDCYLLIGKARMYQGDYMNAVLTFGYVRGNTDDKDARHAALVQLVRTFTESEEFDNALRMREMLRKDKAAISEENTRDYHLVMAHFHRQLENFDLVRDHMELALPLIKGRMERARFNYLLGQLFELEKDNRKAYAHYDKAVKLSPTYELEFHADLARSGLREITSEEVIAETNKYLNKLLNDEKNWEYRDKVYYEMAEFEIRQEKHQEALAFLNESVQVSENPVQKSYSYLGMGKIYYQVLKDYEKAAKYYDSTVQVMPQSLKYYESTKSFSDILQEFVKYLTIVRDQDRLISLAGMTADQQLAFLEQEVETDRETALKDRENRQLSERKRTRKLTVESGFSQAEENNAWYFYNSQATVFGQSNFIRVWGDRTLEDNWRRAAREREVDFASQQANAPAPGQPQQTEEATDNVFAGIKSIDDRLAEIPSTREQMDSVMARLNRGLFGLGKVYYYKLKENDKALETFERLYKEFPEGEFTAEALYILYTMCREYLACDPEVYKMRLVKEHRESFYANILINPRYVEETNMAKKEVQDLYASSYELYKSGQYQAADSLASLTLSKYPENELQDKLNLLKVMIVGQTSPNLDLYHQRLSQFMETWSESDLIPFAEKLMASLNEKMQRLRKLGLPTNGSGQASGQ